MTSPPMRGLLSYKEGDTMTFIEMQKLMNVQLAGETLTFREMIPYFDYVIDDINNELNATYPTFSELLSSAPDADSYAFFPDIYLRKVVIAGAAWNYYTVDEEGLQTAMQYQSDYTKNKFYMVRDMLYNIPEEFQADSERGFIEGHPRNDTVGYRGIEVDLDY